jgi:hypothetical protein
VIRSSESCHNQTWWPVLTEVRAGKRPAPVVYTTPFRIRDLIVGSANLHWTYKRIR